MIDLLQIYKLVKDKDLFIWLFSDLDQDLEDLGYQDDPETFVNDMLMNHFGFSISDDRQLKKFTETVLNKKDLSFLKALP